MATLPTGTITFLFTDIEGSTRRWEEYPSAMQAAFNRQEAILRHAIEANDGYAYKMIGDAFQAAFQTAPQALQAALDAQHSLQSESWPQETGEVRVRMALHTGTTEERGDDYVGPALNRVARLLAAGHGGQILLSGVTYELVRDALPPDAQLLDLGEHRLKDLIRPEHVYQLMAEGLHTRFPHIRTLDARPNNLPVQPNPLIGREKEVEAVQNLIQSATARLVTLTGPGGTGKTRLSMQVGAELLDKFEHGVFFVNLAPITDHALVVSEVAHTLDVKEEAGQPLLDTLKEYLKDKHLLLVLDNFEQVTQAAPLIRQISSAAPRLMILATSRIPLQIAGEKEYAVPPLSLPRRKPPPTLEQLTQYDAVRLFIERARDVKADFEVTNENAPAVAEICHRLDGLPLALELAAARTRILPPQAMLSRLDSRLKVVSSTRRDLPPRQQTLRGAIEWSYDLLDEGEKQLFWRLAIFEGGQTLEAIEAVCNAHGDLDMEVLDGVESLVSKSLLREAGRETGNEREPRFVMLETIHEYAREKLVESGEAPALQREHALYFMQLSAEAEQGLLGSLQAKWFNRLEEELDDIRAALLWARNAATVGDNGNEHAAEVAEIGLRLVTSLWRFWWLRSYLSEGRKQMAAMIATPIFFSSHSNSTLRRLQSKALNVIGALATKQGDYAEARVRLEDGLAIRRELADKSGIAASLLNLAALYSEQGVFASARPLLEEALALRREQGHKHGTASALINLGFAANGEKDHSAARSFFEESMALSREIGDKHGIALALSNLGYVAVGQEDYTLARSHWVESLEIMRELGSKEWIATGLNNLGWIARVQGDYSLARSLCEQSLVLRREIEHKQHIPYSLSAFAAIAVARGQPQRGARLLGATEALLKVAGGSLDTHYATEHDRSAAAARSLLGAEAFTEAWAEGRAMTMEQAVEYALEGG